MSDPSGVRDPELGRQGGRLGWSGSRFLLVGAALGIPGVLLFLLTHGWASALGIALAGLAVPPGLIGIGLVCSALVAQWAARRKPFA